LEFDKAGVLLRKSAGTIPRI